jgi:hypothetical protein
MEHVQIQNLTFEDYYDNDRNDITKSYVTELDEYVYV